MTAAEKDLSLSSIITATVREFTAPPTKLYTVSTTFDYRKEIYTTINGIFSTESLAFDHMVGVMGYNTSVTPEYLWGGCRDLYYYDCDEERCDCTAGYFLAGYIDYAYFAVQGQRDLLLLDREGNIYTGDVNIERDCNEENTCDGLPGWVFERKILPYCKCYSGQKRLCIIQSVDFYG